MDAGVHSSDGITPPSCEHGHPLSIRARFRFDHDASDSGAETEVLKMLVETGIELGATVTLWYCDVCDFARFDFDYPDG